MLTGPAAVAGLTFQGGLASRILRDTGSDPGALALLAFALAELYEACQPGTALSRAAYDSFGGVQDAIARRAETTYGALRRRRKVRSARSSRSWWKSTLNVASRRASARHWRTLLAHYRHGNSSTVLSKPGSWSVATLP